MCVNPKLLCVGLLITLLISVTVPSRCQQACKQSSSSMSASVPNAVPPQKQGSCKLRNDRQCPNWPYKLIGDYPVQRGQEVPSLSLLGTQACASYAALPRNTLITGKHTKFEKREGRLKAIRTKFKGALRALLLLCHQGLQYLFPQLLRFPEEFLVLYK